MISAAQNTLESGDVFEGIKQLSPLSSAIDLVSSVPIDYMHATLEGVVKMLLNYWTNPVHHRKPCYIGLQLSAIDRELMKQRPPSEFTRPPRPIKKHLSYWKASELRNWMLLGKLPPLFFTCLLTSYITKR